MLIAQKCARKQRLAAWSHEWLTAVSRQMQHTCQACQKVNSHASWSTTGKNRTTGHTVISRLGLVTQSSRRPSCEPPLFWKTWRFTFSSHFNINTPYTHKWKRASRENFERETLKKNKIDSPAIYTLESLQIPQLSSSPLSNPGEAFYQNLVLTIFITVRGLFGFLGSS